MLLRILTSNWIAIPILVVAGILLALLHLRGMTTEALVGAGVLVLAAYLIFTGRRGGDSGPDSSF